MAEIVLERVGKRFPDGTQVLKNASFTIHDGEFFVLIGPSGCGKSTLLNLIIGLESVSSGEIRVDGRVVNDLDPKDRNMAMVFQSYAIYPHMSVRDNIAFPLRMARLSKAEINRRIEQAAALLELSGLLERKPADLSGGQRQRVAMGRALVREPVAFLLDEPLSNLDARLRVQMRTEIGRLQNRLGATMIYVTHDQTEAMTLGQRVAVLNRGEVQQIGTPRQLYRTPANLFVAGFIGSPGMNFVAAEVVDSSLVLPFGSAPLPKGYRQFKGRKLIAGFRPEAVILNREASGNEGRALEFQIKADVVEWLGSELFVYADLSGDGRSEQTAATLAYRLDPTLSVRTGETLPLRLDVGDIHLFDALTEHNLTVDGRQDGDTG